MRPRISIFPMQEHQWQKSKTSVSRFKAVFMLFELYLDLDLYVDPKSNSRCGTIFSPENFMSKNMVD